MEIEVEVHSDESVTLSNDGNLVLVSVHHILRQVLRDSILPLYTEPAPLESFILYIWRRILSARVRRIVIARWVLIFVLTLVFFMVLVCVFAATGNWKLVELLVPQFLCLLERLIFGEDRLGVCAPATDV